jgi:hypothetical protein
MAQLPRGHASPDDAGLQGRLQESTKNLYGDNYAVFGTLRVDPSLAALANRRARCPSPPSTMTPAT